MGGGSANLVECAVVVSSSSANSDSSRTVNSDGSEAECYEMGIGTGLVRCTFADDGSDAGFDAGLFLADNSSEITMQAVTLSNGRTGVRSIKGTGFSVHQLFHTGTTLTTPWKGRVKVGNADGQGRRIGACQWSQDDDLMHCFPDSQSHCLQQFPCTPVASKAK